MIYIERNAIPNSLNLLHKKWLAKLAADPICSSGNEWKNSSRKIGIMAAP